MSETLIDPQSTDFDFGLSNPPFDQPYLSQQFDDFDIDFDQTFSFDDILDLVNSDSDPPIPQDFDPKSDHFGQNQILDCQNPVSSESNGSNGSNGVEKCEFTENCLSNVSEESKNGGPVSYSPVSNNSTVKVGVFDKNDGFNSPVSNNSAVKVGVFDKNDGFNSPVSNTSAVKVGVFDKNDGLNGSVKREKIRKRKKIDEVENKECSFDNSGMSEDEKRKARLVRNRESAHLSRQRKKHYVEELEDKVKNMAGMIQDLNMKVSYFMAENVTLRQQVGGAVAVPPVPMMYPPPPGVMYPWMGYPPPPPYMVKNGSQTPLVPIPRLKPQHTESAPKTIKKVESKKVESKRTKKVASVSFLGLLFFIMLFGGLVPMVNVKYGGVKEALVGRESYVGGVNYQSHHGRVLMVNGTVGGGQCVGDGKEFGKCNGSEPLTASLYVPRNDKLVKIDGNLIIHSVLASEKAMASGGKEGGETGLAVRGDLYPAIPVAGVTMAGSRHLPARAADGKVQEWFREGLAGPMLSSGMCTEVFQFDVSSAIVPASSPTNVSNQNTTHLGQQRNRRILYDHPIPLPKSPLNISEREKLNGSNNASSSSSVVVSVLVDPREASDVDGVLGPKSISRIFVVVLIDSVKYVTYSCMLPFKGSTAPHLVTT